MVQIGTGSASSPMSKIMVGTGAAASAAQKIMVGTGSAAVEAWSAVDPIIALGPRHLFKFNGNWVDDMGVSNLSVGASRATIGPETATFLNYSGSAYADLFGLPAGTTGASYTVAMWINPTSAANYPALFSRGNGTSDSIDVYAASGGYYVGVYKDNGTSFEGNFNLNTWQHLAVRITHTGTSNTSAQVWHNGVDLGSASFSKGTRHLSGDALTLGSGFSGEYPFRGQMDTVAYFTRALTTTEVQQLFSAGRR